MSYYNQTQADLYYGVQATKPFGWDTLANKAIILEMATARFDALPWKTPDFATRTQRTNNEQVKAAYYEYVRYLANRDGRIGPITGEVEDPDELNVLSDLPRTVAAMLIPLLNPAELTVQTAVAEATATIGDQTVTYNPAEETASQAAERFAQARLNDARAKELEAKTGEIFTEPEQQLSLIHI